MNDIPGLRLAPTRMIALVGQGGRPLDSVSPKSTPAERHAAGWSDPRVLAAKPLEVPERTITNADTTPATQRRVARVTPNHSERMGDADGVPEVELSFGDFLDLINPLQHIPIVGTIYRAITGDEISPSASIFGGLLFGGPLGFMVAIVNTLIDEISGRDLGETVLAAILDDAGGDPVQTARAEPVPADLPTNEPERQSPPRHGPGAVPPRVNNDLAPPDQSPATAPGRPLRGQAALDAFIADLRRSERLGDTAVAAESPKGLSIPVAPPLQTAARAGPAPDFETAPRPAPGSVTARPIGPIQAHSPIGPGLNPSALEAAVSGEAIAERMKYALDKYQALLRARDREDRGPRAGPGREPLIRV